jgi:hypothetical protein
MPTAETAMESPAARKGRAMEPGGSGAVGAERMPVLVVIKVLTVIEISTFVAPPRVIVPVGRVAIRSVIGRALRASGQANQGEKRGY